MKSLDEIRQECKARMDALKPAVEEHARLSAVLMEFDRIMGTEVTPAAVKRPGGRPKGVAKPKPAAD